MPATESAISVVGKLAEILQRTDVAKLAEQKTTADFSHVFESDSVIKWCEESKSRLRQEIVQLGRRGNVNLIIGFMTTLMAAAVLTYVALVTPDSLTTEHILVHYIPRISLAIFIEVFSFFFLRLYRSVLTEIKYFKMNLQTSNPKLSPLLGPS
jgi:hypothetical protein